MPQFFIDPQSIEGGKVLLSKEEAHHVTRVLRYTPGDKIHLTDGLGHRFLGEIIKLSPKETMVQILSKETIPYRSSPTFAAALLKQERWDFVLEKATELGCEAFSPFFSKRTVVKLSTKEMPAKTLRWERVMLAAAKQCFVTKLPKILSPVSFEDFVRTFSRFTAILFFYEESKNILREVFKKSDLAKPLVVVGPEGGFEREEVRLAKAHGAKIVSLGAQTLRAETAAVAALTLCQYEMGNLTW